MNLWDFIYVLKIVSMLKWHNKWHIHLEGSTSKGGCYSEPRHMVSCNLMPFFLSSLFLTFPIKSKKKKKSTNLTFYCSLLESKTSVSPSKKFCSIQVSYSLKMTKPQFMAKYYLNFSSHLLLQISVDQFKTYVVFRIFNDY